VLGSRDALEGERKRVTVLFADVKGALELLADRDPEEARKLLDPVLERMMKAVHRYAGTRPRRRWRPWADLSATGGTRCVYDPSGHSGARIA
jgi:class 3 adenylate cyclase